MTTARNASGTRETIVFDGRALANGIRGELALEISKLADNSLLEAYLQGLSRVTREIVEHCSQSVI